MSIDPDSVELVVFDAYGTLLDLNSAIASHRDALGEDAEAIASLWRQKQLEYSWLIALRGDYQDFWALTERALRYAFLVRGLAADTQLFQRLLDAYWRLGAYDDVSACLTWLQEQGFRTAILSNGSKDMLRGAVESAGISSRLNAVFSVDVLSTYKPHPAVYNMPIQAYSLETNEVLFVSSNTWDVSGAKTFGYQVAWLDRNETAFLDELPGTPDIRLASLLELPDHLL